MTSDPHSGPWQAAACRRQAAARHCKSSSALRVALPRNDRCLTQNLIENLSPVTVQGSRPASYTRKGVKDGPYKVDGSALVSRRRLPRRSLSAILGMRCQGPPALSTGRTLRKAKLEELRRAASPRQRGDCPRDGKHSDRPGGSLGIAKRASALRRAADERPARWPLAGGGVPAAGGGKASRELVSHLRGLATERQIITPRQGIAVRPPVLSQASPIDRAGGP